MNLLRKLELEEINRLRHDKQLPKTGDQVSVKYHVEKNRFQTITGICISHRRKNKINAAFKLYIMESDILYFIQLLSPSVSEITILKDRKLKRKNIHYITKLSTKQARLKISSKN